MRHRRRRYRRVPRTPIVDLDAQFDADSRVSDPPPEPGTELDLAAAGLRAQHRDVHALLEALAVRLEDALPGAVNVRRRRNGRFRSKQGEVSEISLSLGDERFELVGDAASYRCLRHRVVRGITLAREEVPLQTWVNDVVRTVSERTAVGESQLAALEELLT